ncbi:MAG TPA: DinB family protein [Gemmatimonadaceae bacterium]|nr:DinB family protein [Gemmatimonadaceae bacterium]
MTQSPFLERSRYYLAYEYPTKIRLAVENLDDAVMWKRPNEESNSIANLLLHLAGNVREWIVCGIGGTFSDRNRASEFAAKEGFTRPQLLSALSESVLGADKVLGSLSNSDLEKEITIQGRDTTVFAAIYHVVEHFSMHTGQIIMLAKIYRPGSVHFYENAGGIAVPVWGGTERMKSI